MGDWTIRLIDQTGYVGIFLLMFLETIFPPIPSEVIMPIAGVRAAQGPLTLWGVIASGTAGAMLGNLFWYALARVIGMRRFRPFIERYGRWLTMDWDDVEKAERLFGRFGGTHRLARPDAADDPLGHLDPGRPAQHAAEELPDLVDDRHRRLDRGAGHRRLGPRPGVSRTSRRCSARCRPRSSS